MDLGMSECTLFISSRLVHVLHSESISKHVSSSRVLNTMGVRFRCRQAGEDAHVRACEPG
jgi:hypothetical protein